MSIGIILASHGEFAKGVRQSGSMLFGNPEKVEVITFMPGEGPEDLSKKYQEAIEKFSPEDQILFLVDLWGGSPFNEANRIFEQNQETTGIIAGLNLPILIQAYAEQMDPEQTAKQAVINILKEIKTTGIKVRPDELQTHYSTPTQVVNKKSSFMPEGTVVGDGKLRVAFARIDSRLVHGQVASAWTKEVRPDRIIVVSDRVSKDELRKKLLKQAAPSGVPVNIVPIKKMVEVLNDTRFGGQKIFFLFENPQEAVIAIESGVPIKNLNVGGMVHSEGKTLISKAIAVDHEDIVAFNHLKELGVELEVRQLPSNSKENIFKLIENAHLK
ncbi:mannose/fructose/sorbose PTS transporter subunit IIB [Lactococcus lactis]|uniref:PTS system mannose-specific EIIAB component n=1 Tax=Lactococcus lactis TaxID=1358 RepID=A0A9X4S2Z3_9LACT|nr:mannose/fructose/sorbose PTS transporter subunit IIB [Lactococcus lactis]MDG4982385.1 mannose/fructose/sorbose PTS transporter subunit IIB [Lactococcus lactis]